MKSTEVQTLGAYEAVYACSKVAHILAMALGNKGTSKPLQDESNTTLGLCTGKVLTQRVEGVQWGT